MPRTLFLLFFSLACLTATAQKKKLGLGLKWVNDLTLNYGLAPGIGIQATYRLTEHGGFESGIYFSTWNHHYISTDGAGLSSGRIAERHLYLPVLYRYVSRRINFTAGAAADFFLQYNQKDKYGNITLAELEPPGTSMFFTAGVSRSVYLSKTLILEPEIRINYKFLDDDGSLGLNLALRKEIL